MAKKKKKYLIKLNNKIRTYFSGLPFDEGIDSVCCELGSDISDSSSYATSSGSRNEGMKYDDKGNDTLCCVCLTRKATFVFVRCGHQCLCHKCRDFMQVYKKSRTTERDPAEVAREYQNHRGSLDMAFPCPFCRTVSKQIYTTRFLGRIYAP